MNSIFSTPISTVNSTSGNLNFLSSVYYIRNYLSFANTTNLQLTPVQRIDYLGSSMNIVSQNLLKAITLYQPLLITPEYAQSPELIAYDYYGSVNLFWIITRYNGIYNILDDTVGIFPGRTINIPDPNQVKQWLQTIGVSATTQARNNTNSFVTVP